MWFGVNGVNAGRDGLCPEEKISFPGEISHRKAEKNTQQASDQAIYGKVVSLVMSQINPSM